MLCCFSVVIIPPGSCEVKKPPKTTGGPSHLLAQQPWLAQGVMSPWTKPELQLQAFPRSKGLACGARSGKEKALLPSDKTAPSYPASAALMLKKWRRKRSRLKGIKHPLTSTQNLNRFSHFQHFEIPLTAMRGLQCRMGLGVSAYQKPGESCFNFNCALSCSQLFRETKQLAVDQHKVSQLLAWGIISPIAHNSSR